MNGTFCDVNGIRIWYADVGSGEPLVMLHPGGVGAIAFRPNVDGLAARFHVYLPERRGHGHSPDVDGPYTYELMADDTIAFLERIVGRRARLVGMSDGAIVALLTALKKPALVEQLVCVAGVFHNSGWAPGVLAPPDSTATSGFLQKLHDMHTHGPTLAREALTALQCRTLVMCADDDEVRLEHAIDFYRALPDGELAVVPGTSHGLLVEKPALCEQVLLDFLTKAPVPTLAPIRRK